MFDVEVNREGPIWSPVNDAINTSFSEHGLHFQTSPTGQPNLPPNIDPYTELPWAALKINQRPNRDGRYTFHKASDTSGPSFTLDELARLVSPRKMPHPLANGRRILFIGMKDLPCSWLSFLMLNHVQHPSLRISGHTTDMLVLPTRLQLEFLLSPALPASKKGALTALVQTIMASYLQRISRSMKWLHL